MRLDAIQNAMFADKDDVPKGNPSDAASGSRETAQPVPNEADQKAEGSPIIIRHKRRRRHRRTRRKQEVKAKLIWEICLGGVLLAVLVLLLFALSQSTTHVTQPPPAPVPQELGN
jgi:uncharacterized integral membrane protein